MQDFTYHRPSELEDVVALLQNFEGNVRLLAGGTDLTVGLRHAKFHVSHVVDIKRVKALASRIDVADGFVHISSTVTITQLVAHDLMQHWFPALMEAAVVVGSRQIRNRATLVGNICNASPAADTVPALVLYDASVRIHGPAGMREMAVVDFIRGNRNIDLQAGEIVTAVRIPLPKQPHGAAFGRITRRRGVDLATVNLCCSVSPEGRARMVLGAAAPRPLVVEDVDGVFSNPSAAPSERREALARILSIGKPISDVRASADYRMAMLNVLAHRALDKALKRRNAVQGEA